MVVESREKRRRNGTYLTKLYFCMYILRLPTPPHIHGYTETWGFVHIRRKGDGIFRKSCVYVRLCARVRPCARLSFRYTQCT